MRREDVGRGRIAKVAGDLLRRWHRAVGRAWKWREKDGDPAGGAGFPLIGGNGGDHRTVEGPIHGRGKDGDRAWMPDGWHQWLGSSEQERESEAAADGRRRRWRTGLVWVMGSGCGQRRWRGGDGVAGGMGSRRRWIGAGRIRREKGGAWGSPESVEREAIGGDGPAGVEDGGRKMEIGWVAARGEWGWTVRGSQLSERTVEAALNGEGGGCGFRMEGWRRGLGVVWLDLGGGGSQVI